MIYHFAYFGPLLGKVEGVAPGPSWLVAGRFGVSAFFIISGFVIIYSAGNRGAGAFALARLARLAPAMLACATVTMLVLTLWPGTVPAPSILTYLKSASTVGLLAGAPYVDGSYWSITIELRFYLYVALMLLVLRNTDSVRAVTVAWMAGSFTAMAFYGFTPLRILTLSPHSGFFIIGLIFYCWFILDDRRFVAWALPPALALAAWQSFIEFKHIAEMQGGHTSMWVGVGAATVSTVLVRLMAFGISAPRLAAAARALGAISYPLYLLHQTLGYRLIEGMVEAGFTASAAIALAAITMCSGAWVLATYIEPVGGKLITQAGNAYRHRAGDTRSLRKA
jgi:peptidoglycan/LPS O-acetylase OafA/YrhL